MDSALSLQARLIEAKALVVSSVRASAGAVRLSVLLAPNQASSVRKSDLRTGFWWAISERELTMDRDFKVTATPAHP